MCSVDPRYLKLTPLDDHIYKSFRDEFPTLDVRVMLESELKSATGKEKWRPYCERFKHCLDDYSFGTLLRIDADKEYTEENTMLVIRVQFYAIELARNREGINGGLRRRFRPNQTTVSQPTANSSSFQPGSVVI